ncbi:MAG: hypothetical protein HXS50_00285, partial [Theionarchaea archaeon]|nr:hypothetical protein [Theionarchaea archaeon]
MVTFLPDVFPMRGEYRTCIDLNGMWSLRRDPGNVGLGSGWHEGRGKFRQKMEVPGVPQAQGVGEPATNLKTFFDEPFWIRRKFEVPFLPEGKRLWLRIGGILPAADIYLNGIHVGYTKSSRTPQRIDVTELVVIGKENLIAIRVCEPPEVRLDGVYEMPALTYNWTGPYGPISFEVTGDPSIVDLYARPDLESSGIRLSVSISHPAKEPCCLVAIVRDGQRTMGTARIELGTGSDHADTFLGIGEYRTWSPEDPCLYDLQISL